jgi:hypothetical protein
MMNFFRSLAEPTAQLVICCILIASSLALTVGVFLRFIPGLEGVAIGSDEPFWVLLLSILALLFAGIMGLPGALAYREVKRGNQ